MLKSLFTLSSSANVLAGAVLICTWASNWATDPAHHVPIIVLVIGGAMLIQGLYSVGYSLGWWEDWGEIAAGALLAGQLISACAGSALLVYGFFYNARSARGDFEPAPLLAGLMIAANASLALLLLLSSGALTPKTRARAAS